MEKIVQYTDTSMMIVPYYPKLCRDIEKNNSDYDRIYHKYKEVSGFYVPWDIKDIKKKSKDDIYCYLTYYQNPSMYDTSLKEYSIIPSPLIQSKNMKRFTLRDGEELTDLQIQMVNQIQAGRTMKDLLNNKWYLHLDTGYGKTMLSIYLASEINLKTIIVYPSKKLLEQWKNTLIDKFTIESCRILHIDSSALMNAISEHHHDPKDEDVFLISSSLISNYGNKFGYSKLQKVIKMLGIGCLIIDEAHQRMGNTIRLTACANIEYVQYLSADYGQGQYKKEQRFLSAFATVPVIRPQKEIRDEMKYTVGVIVKFNSMPTKHESQFAIYNNYGYDSEKYMSYEMSKDTFKEAILWIIKRINKVNTNHYQTLILFTNIWAVDQMKEYLEENPYMSGKSIARYHGKVTDEEKEMYRDADFIIATYASFSTGIDIKTIKYVIGTNQSNKVEDNQTAGRAGRKFKVQDDSEVFYFMLVDEGFSYCKRKLPNRIGYLQDMKLKKIVQCRFYDIKNLDIEDPPEI